VDAGRFDTLARALAHPGSRRAALAALLSLAASRLGGATPVGAQAAGVPLGGACAAREECAAVDPAAGWVACRANGIDDDGAANCCLVAGSACMADEECCGEDLCTPPGICGPVTESGLPAGAYCTGAAQCSPHAFYGGWPVYCMDNGDPDDGPTNCCRPAGSTCNADAHCCWSAACVDGRCGA